MSIRSLLCYQTCGHSILKKIQQILMQADTIGPRVKGMKRSALEVRRSKVKVTRGWNTSWKYRSARLLKNYLKNFNQTLQVRTTVNARCVKTIKMLKVKGHTSIKPGRGVSLDCPPPPTGRVDDFTAKHSWSMQHKVGSLQQWIYSTTLIEITFKIRIQTTRCKNNKQMVPDATNLALYSLFTRWRHCCSHRFNMLVCEFGQKLTAWSRNRSVSFVTKP